MKKYEFQNYITHRSASIVTDEERYPGYWFVLFYDKGELDSNVKGTGSDRCNGEKRFTNEAAAIRSAKHYVTKGA